MTVLMYLVCDILDFHKREEVFFRLGIIYKLQGKADASLEVG
jgi:hypothetical protein